MKKFAVVFVLVIIAVATSSYYYFSGKEFVVRLTEAEIQSKLDEKLPLTKTYLFIIQITLDNPRIHLENNSKRVSMGLDANFNITLDKNPKPLGGTVDVSGGIIYVAEKGQFFLTDPLIQNLGVQGIPKKYTNRINSALTKALDGYYKKHPIYTLARTDAKEAAARLILKDVIIDNNELVITLGI